MTHKDLLIEFINFEHEFKLLDLEINNIPIWQLIRIPIFNKLKSKIIGGSFEISDRESKKIIIGFKYFLKNLLFCNPYFIKNEKEILILNHSRRKWNGKIYEDIYTDYFLKNIDEKEYVVLERFNNLSHLTPTNTNNLFYLDFLEYPARFLSRIPLSLDNIQIDELNRLFYEKWNIKDVIEPNLIKKTIRYYQFVSPIVERLLRKIKPRLIIEVVSYSLINQIFTINAKRKFISVIELQHGTVGPYHIGYNYQRIQNLESFPDYFFSWGDFWTENAKLPIDKNNIRPVGFPFIDKYKEVDSGYEKNNQMILIISQLRNDIAEITYKLAVQLPRFEFIFKAHPKEYSIAKIKYELLSKLPNVKIVDNDHISLYNLFNKCKFVLGVSSTALIESLGFNCDVIILKLPGWEYFENLESSDNVFFTSDVNEIIDFLGIQNEEKKISNTEYFFQSNSSEKITSELNKTKSQHNK